MHGLQIRNLSARFWQVSACHFGVYFLHVFWIIRLKAFTGLRHCGGSLPVCLNCHHRWTAELMKCPVCASLEGQYFTSFERRRWHLQVVETTKVLQLGFSESKSINICSGPDAITWQNWSTSFIIINTSQVCVFWGVLVQSLSVFTFWFGHRAGQSAPWSGFSARFSLLSVLVWGVHSEQRTSPCAGQCLSPTNTQIR